MPQILIVTDSPDSAGVVIYRESVSPVHLASAHSGDQLVERLTWAIGDAALAERRARQPCRRVGRAGHWTQGVQITGR